MRNEFDFGLLADVAVDREIRTDRMCLLPKDRIKIKHSHWHMWLLTHTHKPRHTHTNTVAMESLLANKVSNHEQVHSIIEEYAILLPTYIIYCMMDTQYILSYNNSIYI